MRYKLCLLLIFSILLSSGCSDSPSQNFENTTIRAAEIIELEEEFFPELLDYIGTIEAKEIKKYSFKSSGKINKIYVNEGQPIKKGEPLVELDKRELCFALDAAKSQMEAAKAQYIKVVKGASQEDMKKAELNMNNAQEAYDFALDTYNDLKGLYENGAISKQKFDEAKLQLDYSKNNLALAQEMLSQVKKGSPKEDKQALLAQHEQAKTNYEAQLNLVEDALIKSDIKGYVVDILGKEGEMIGAGYPVIVIGSDEQIVKVGLSQRDVEKIKVGIKARIKVEEVIREGIVTNISNTLDIESRTHKVEIKLMNDLSQNKFYIGSIARVYLQIGEKKGIWIPITNIMNDGLDYVYVVEDNRVVRKNIDLGFIYEDKVLVKGLNIGDKLVVKGMKNLKEGYKVVTQ